MLSALCVSAFTRYAENRRDAENAEVTQRRKGVRVIKLRDLVVAVVTVLATLLAVRINAQKPVMQSTTFEWNSIPVERNVVCSVRQFFKSPTVSLY